VRKLDANDAKITRALREQGALVWHLDCREPGRPDKLIAFLGRLTLLEIKAPKTGRLSREQREAHAEMARHGVRVHVVRTVREAFEAVGIGQRVDAERRRALGDIAANIRKKSDDFERRARLVPATHDYRGSSAWEDAHRESPIPDKVLL
jgi:hypothetical protein